MAATAGLKNGDIITGPSGEQTQLFFQNAAPTPDVANALWYQTSTGILCFRKSPYWLSVNTFPISFPSLSTVNNTTVTSSPVYVPYNVYWESLSLTVADTSGSIESPASVGLVEILGKSIANGTGTTRFTVFSEDIALTDILPIGTNPNATRVINYPVVEPSNANSLALSYVFTVYGVGMTGFRLSVKARWII